VALPRVDAIAAKDTKGKLWLDFTNPDPNRPVEIEASLAGITAKSATGETLTAPKVDSVNPFGSADTRHAKGDLSEGAGRQADFEIGAEVGNHCLS